jgi:hypothetical protein
MTSALLNAGVVGNGQEDRLKARKVLGTIDEVDEGLEHGVSDLRLVLNLDQNALQAIEVEGFWWSIFFEEVLSES